MKRNLIGISILSAAFVLTAGHLAAAEIMLEALNPRGEITLPPLTAPNARITELAGKKIGLYWNGKAGGNHFWNGIEQQLKQKAQNTTVLRYEGAFDLGADLRTGNDTLRKADACGDLHR
jgi:hypothetical protein